MDSHIKNVLTQMSAVNHIDDIDGKYICGKFESYIDSLDVSQLTKNEVWVLSMLSYNPLYEKPHPKLQKLYLKKISEKSLPIKEMISHPNLPKPTSVTPTIKGASMVSYPNLPKPSPVPTVESTLLKIANDFVESAISKSFATVESVVPTIDRIPTVESVIQKSVFKNGPSKSEEKNLFKSVLNSTEKVSNGDREFRKQKDQFLDEIAQMSHYIDFSEKKLHKLGGSEKSNLIKTLRHQLTIAKDILSGKEEFSAYQSDLVSAETAYPLSPLQFFKLDNVRIIIKNCDVELYFLEQLLERS